MLSRHMFARATAAFRSKSNTSQNCKPLLNYGVERIWKHKYSTSHEGDQSKLPLAGVKVVDLTRVLAGVSLSSTITRVDLQLSVSVRSHRAIFCTYTKVDFGVHLAILHSTIRGLRVRTRFLFEFTAIFNQQPYISTS